MYSKQGNFGDKIIKIIIPSTKSFAADILGDNAGYIKSSRIVTVVGTGFDRIHHTVWGSNNPAVIASVVKQTDSIELYLKHNGTFCNIYILKVSDVTDFNIVGSIPENAENVPIT